MAAKTRAKTNTKKTGTNGSAETPVIKPGRFAHPFFIAMPASKLPMHPGTGRRITRMVEYVATKLEKIPAPKRLPPTMSLAEVIGQQAVNEIVAAKSISFHATGDTGHANGLGEELVAEAMALDYDIKHPKSSPAFFLHLGDVIYFNNTDQGYYSQFYVPYKTYPGKIIAIPGNHDGEIFAFDGSPTGQKITLGAFQANFCLPQPSVPPAAKNIYREMVSQPGVYWLLNAPFVDIIGLYSNVAEGPGFISGTDIGTAQKDWLTQTLTGINNARTKKNRNALVIAVHHPPFSNGGHSSSVDMLADIDDACTQAGIMPDAVLAAHSHNYQRFTRNVMFKGKNMQIPYIVAGVGGRGISPAPPGDGSTVTDVFGSHTFNNSFMGYGYLTLAVTKKQLKIAVYQLGIPDGSRKLYETILVNLSSNTVVVL